MLSSVLHSLDGFEVQSPGAVSGEQWNMLNGSSEWLAEPSFG